MTHRILALAALAALGLGAILLPRGGAAASDTPMEPPVPTTIPANDAEKKSIMESVAEAGADKTSEALLKALTAMQTRKHEEFVPTIRANLDSSDPKVQAAAIVAAAGHELKDLEKTVRKTMRAKQKKGSGEPPGVVAAACIEYLDRLAIAGEEEFVVTDGLRFVLAEERRLRAGWARDMFRVSIHYLGRMKSKAAVSFLIDELLAQPVPKDPNDPKNPPSSYWEARTKLWQDYESWARWALKETTGQEYRSVREWQAWLKQQDKKSGYK